MTRFFISNRNHQFQKLYKLRVEQQNNINNIISPIQGTDINEKVIKNDKYIYN